MQNTHTNMNSHYKHKETIENGIEVSLGMCQNLSHQQPNCSRPAGKTGKIRKEENV